MFAMLKDLVWLTPAAEEMCMSISPLANTDKKGVCIIM